MHSLKQHYMCDSISKVSYITRQTPDKLYSMYSPTYNLVKVTQMNGNNIAADAVVGPANLF